MRGKTFKSLGDVGEFLEPGQAVVIIDKGGFLVLYDDPKNTNHPYELNLLKCNLAGAQVIYGNQAFIFLV